MDSTYSLVDEGTIFPAKTNLRETTTDFDVDTQEYLDLDHIEALRFMPYARLTVVEDGISFFRQMKMDIYMQIGMI